MRLLNRPVVRVRQTLIEDLACQSKACAPPPVGTGGSNASGGGGSARHAAIAKHMARGGGAEGEAETGPVSGRSVMADGSIPADTGKVMLAMRGGIESYDERQMQSELYAARGYDAKARVLSREEFNDATEEGLTEGWRGLEVRSEAWGPVRMMQDPAGFKREERMIARDLIDGDTHYAGLGIYGNGTYVALHDNTSMARMAASGYGNNLIRVGLPKSITDNTFEQVDEVGKYVQDIIYDGARGPRKESRYDDGDGDEPHDQAVHDAAYKTAKNMIDAGRSAGLADDDIIIATGDTGRVATMLGIDGYVDRKGAGSTSAEYVIVLNRGAITLDSTVYDETGINPRHKP